MMAVSPSVPSESGRKRASGKAVAGTSTVKKAPTKAEALKLMEQLRVHQAELEMQNDELRRVQAELEASRALYFDLYHLAPVGYVKVDASGSILESNLRAAGLFGAAKPKLTGRKFSRLIVSADADSYYLAQRRLFQKGTPQVCELRLKRQDGSTFWGRLEMSTSSYSRPGEETSRIVIVDISDRKLAEERFDAFMEHTPAPASIVDEEGRYVYVNAALQRYTGRKAEAWVGHSFSEIWPSATAERLRRQHSRALNHGEITSETETLALGAEMRVNQVLRFPFMGANGQKMVGTVAIDVTERHRLEIALREANGQLSAEKQSAEQATKAKSRFLSAMSHEIRTPLNGVVGMAGLLLQTELTSEQTSYTGMIAESAELLLSLVNDVLDLAKIEAGKFELDESPFDIDLLVEDALSLMAFKAHEKSLELASRRAKNSPRYFIGDAGRIRQVLMNLLSNAVKFTHAGYVLVRVEAAEPSGGRSEVRLAVQDTGIGISKEKLPHLFTSFGQGDTTIASRYGGTGLGLSIVKQVVELMGGEVGVESREGTGSTFFCTLPLRVQELTTDEMAMPDKRLEGSSVLLTGAHGINSIVVLELCERWGMKVRECEPSSARDVLATARKERQPYDAVILTGGSKVLLEVADSVRQEREANSKLILISSELQDKNRSVAADSFLSTPVRSKALWDALCQVIGTGDSAGSPRFRGGSNAVGSAASGKFGGVKVLVTDDNAINQRLACALLRKLGCEVDTANDGCEAVKKAAAVKYDLVFMDCVMPEMDGFAATAAIRALTGEHASMPIVALTASATNEDRVHCLAVGMDDFLTKPIRPEQLAQCLSKWMAQSRVAAVTGD